MRFRSKQVEVEAGQYLLDVPLPRGVAFAFTSPYVVTIHLQRVYVEPGDWIVVEPDGEHFYPVKPDVFVKRWEPILDGRPVVTVADSLAAAWRDRAIAVHDSLRSWCDNYGGSFTPIPSVTINGYAISIAIGDINVWDSESGYADETDDPGDDMVDQPKASRCIACYKRLVEDLRQWPS